jgi:hypothetical protein
MQESGSLDIATIEQEPGQQFFPTTSAQPRTHQRTAWTDDERALQIQRSSTRLPVDKLPESMDVHDIMG